MLVAANDSIHRTGFRVRSFFLQYVRRDVRLGVHVTYAEGAQLPAERAPRTAIGCRAVCLVHAAAD